MLYMVCVALCLQAVKDLVRMYLLNVQSAHRALQRVVVRVSMRPSKTVPVEVLGGK